MIGIIADFLKTIPKNYLLTIVLFLQGKVFPNLEFIIHFENLESPSPLTPPIKGGEVEIIDLNKKG